MLRPRPKPAAKGAAGFGLQKESRPTAGRELSRVCTLDHPLIVLIYPFHRPPDLNSKPPWAQNPGLFGWGILVPCPRWISAEARTTMFKQLCQKARLLKQGPRPSNRCLFFPNSNRFDVRAFALEVETTVYRWDGGPLNG